MKSWFWNMHGLIFETSIWLLAGSTRWQKHRLACNQWLCFRSASTYHTQCCKQHEVNIDCIVLRLEMWCGPYLDPSLTTSKTASKTTDLFGRPHTVRKPRFDPHSCRTHLCTQVCRKTANSSTNSKNDPLARKKNNSSFAFLFLGFWRLLAGPCGLPMCKTPLNRKFDYIFSI